MRDIYFKAAEMFKLVENSEIAYYMSLSLSKLLLFAKDPNCDILALEILQMLLKEFSQCKEDDPEEFIERLYQAIATIIISLGYWEKSL